jgi:uracil-DNA glycosylase
MSLTREDMLRELELLPVWRLNSPLGLPLETLLEAPVDAPLEAKQEAAPSDAPIEAVIDKVVEPKIEAKLETEEESEVVIEEKKLTPQALESQAPALPDVAIMDWAELKQHVAGSGDQNADWVFVGGALADGDASVLLDKMLIAIQLQRGKNVYLTQLSELDYFNRQIALIQPKLIVAFGEQVAQRLLDSNEPLDALRGKVHRYQDFSVVVSYAPSHLLEHTQDKAKAWADLCLARSFMQDVK